MDVDNSLLLSYDRREDQPKNTERAALSPSQAGRFDEDPHLYYLKKVRGLDEPYSMPLALGIAVHEAMEKFLRQRYRRGRSQKQATRSALSHFDHELGQAWEQLPDKEKTVRVNPDDPTNPRGREEFEVKLGEQSEKLSALLQGLWSSIDELDFNIFRAQRNPEALEASVGQRARENDLPWATIDSYDPYTQESGDMPVAVVGGVPVRGRIDCIGRWPGGTPGIIDHKCVGKVISFYPTYNNQRVSYDPSYDPATDLQLDLYSAGAGIPRAGFQFMLRRPQYLPDDNVLREGWVDERQFEGQGLPTTLVNGEDGLRYVGIYRPTEEDGADPAWQLPGVRYRAAWRVRDIAERLTESLLLYKNGVDPEVAFPPGDPDEIAQKACPFCHFNDTHACIRPRENTQDSREQYASTVKRRERLASSLSPITERRERWAALREENGLPERERWAEQV